MFVNHNVSVIHSGEFLTTGTSIDSLYQGLKVKKYKKESPINDKHIALFLKEYSVTNPDTRQNMVYSVLNRCLTDDDCL
jgi:hypothetical protein